MIKSLKNSLLKLTSSNFEEVEEALDFIRKNNERGAIPNLIEKLKETKSPSIRNSIAMLLSDLEANEAVPILLDLISNPANEGYTGTLIYALQNLECKLHFLSFVNILLHGNFENREMALGLIEKYLHDIDVQTREKAINVLETEKEKLKESEISDYITHTLRLLKEKS